MPQNAKLLEPVSHTCRNKTQYLPFLFCYEENFWVYSRFLDLNLSSDTKYSSWKQQLQYISSDCIQRKDLVTVKDNLHLQDFESRGTLVTEKTNGNNSMLKLTQHLPSNAPKGH